MLKKLSAVYDDNGTMYVYDAKVYAVKESALGVCSGGCGCEMYRYAVVVEMKNVDDPGPWIGHIECFTFGDGMIWDRDKAQQVQADEWTGRQTMFGEEVPES